MNNKRKMKKKKKSTWEGGHDYAWKVQSVTHSLCSPSVFQYYCDIVVNKTFSYYGVGVGIDQ
jgi:hypothetical protein